VNILIKILVDLMEHVQQSVECTTNRTARILLELSVCTRTSCNVCLCMYLHVVVNMYMNTWKATCNIYVFTNLFVCEHVHEHTYSNVCMYMYVCV